MKKRTAFITIHVGTNFGSVLQSIATQEVLKQIGTEPILVNYIPSRVTYRRYFKDMCNGITSFIKKVVFFPNFIKNKIIYDDYLKTYCKLSAPIYDNDNFVEKCPKADYYITGSDQVWNSKHNEGFNNRYFFAQFPADANRISFASSIGETDLSKVLYDKMKECLSHYNAISVREASAKELINTMGYEATHLLDPTFMLNKEQWEKYMTPRKVKENYLLIYTPYNTTNKAAIFDTARKIAQEHNLKVVTFSWDWRKDKMADQTIRYATPGDFLSLMHHADFIVTNSFHGTAFSINLNKEFVVYMPSAFGTRISSIIELCGLESRVVRDFFSTEQTKKNIDYTRINTILDNERSKSIEFLKKAIS